MLIQICSRPSFNYQNIIEFDYKYNLGFQSSFGYFHHANDFYTEKAGVKCNGTMIIDLWDFDAPVTGENGTIYEEAMFKKHLLNVVNNHDPSILCSTYRTYTTPST